MRIFLRAGLIALLAAGAAGCSDSTDAPRDERDRLQGTVESVYDDLPTDGGAGLWLRDDADGALKHAYLPSLFTYPPPDDATLAAVDRVMPVLRRLQPGDHVLAEGQLDEQGLRLELLTSR